MRRIDRIVILIALLLFGRAIYESAVRQFGLFVPALPPPVTAPVPDALPQPRPRAGRPLPPPSDSDPGIDIPGAGPRRPNTRSAGTAFAVGADGVWLTARHVTDGCRAISLRRGERDWIAASVAYTDPQADVTVLTTRWAGPRLPIYRGPLVYGQDGYAFGFAGEGGPSAIHATAIGRTRLKAQGRLQGITPAITWAERDIQPPGDRWIGGMSGGPLVTADGWVAGVVSAASKRRGRIHTVAPETIAEIAGRNGFALAPAGASAVAVTPATGPAVRGALMDRRSVVQVLCAS